VHLESFETEVNLRQPSREGLPAAFKMRRERHYVEQLMGDAPLRTVREIPVSDIDPPEENAVDLAPLEQSIRDLGILQPLLVSKSGAGSGLESGAPDRFALIAGANRFRVAVQIGLRTVPCLVCETGSHTVEALREAATRRASLEAPTSELEASSAGENAQDAFGSGAETEARSSGLAAGLREVTERLSFVSAVMPTLDVAGNDPLRWNTLTDLMKVEMERARTIAAAIEWLSQTSTADRDLVEASTLVDAVIETVTPEARLEGVTLEISSSLDGYSLPVDRAMVVRALTALTQAMVALSSAGSTVRIECTGTTIRPALIVAVTQEDREVSDSAAARFFDAGFVDHPNGPAAALVLAGVAHVARLHGGRVHARSLDGGGCTATFVIPKPVWEV
jgi:ParB-like chromosome segregation protein Spo0J